MKRVFGYARPSDYGVAGGMAAVSPLSFWVMERVSPSHVGKGGFAPVMRLATALGFVGGLHILYQRSCSMSTPEIYRFGSSTNTSTDRFYGFTENSREAELDNREMVDKVKGGEPLYGASKVSTYLQGVAARNSRYSQLFIHVLPWFNAVNHDQVSHSASFVLFIKLSRFAANCRNQHGVDTAKYYQQAERELEAERLAKAGSS